MIKPLADRVLIKPIEHTTETSFGLILNNGVTNEGIVVAIGSGVKDVALGDVVRYTNAGKLDAYLLCREADVLCVVTPDATKHIDIKAV